METNVLFSRTASFWGRVGYSKLAAIEARGHSGGLWILTQFGSNISFSIIDISPYAVTFKLSLGGRSWVCIGLYARPISANRPAIWNYFCNLNSSISAPWLIIGDFNEIVFPCEQKGGTFLQSKVDVLLRMMDDCDFLDLLAVGGHFTWTHNCWGHRKISKKLDRGIGNITWRDSFPESFVEILCRLHSDHNPILVKCIGIPEVRGPQPFRFEVA